MPSFDIVSKVNGHEITNVIDQTLREINQRFDFKGSNASVVHEDQAILVSASSEFQVKQILDILFTRAANRGLDRHSFSMQIIVLSYLYILEN